MIDAADARAFAAAKNPQWTRETNVPTLAQACANSNVDETRNRRLGH
ncbi:hypothetical protein LVB77_11020 [Lysobacter sp. 5GHs7-4]|nr:hypothetical protein [Lysobacter sp. 5GHs7-4]UHQ21230.1 hypothetical protein LVB77_11020 [Lysobacter sp. 5GHs7-4]